MKIAGFKKQSLIDYPGHISSMVFTQGCNFRCVYCHNPELVLPEKFGEIYPEELVFDYLDKYKHLLDALCISGGEPCMQKDLPEFIDRVKKLGLKIKLDTNGTRSSVLKLLFERKLVDFVAMDIKTILEYEAYREIVGDGLSEECFSNVLESVELIENSGIDYEFRTTVVKNFHSEQYIESLIKRFGAHYKLQNFNPDVVLNTELDLKRYDEGEMKQFYKLDKSSLRL